VHNLKLLTGESGT